MKVSLRKGHSYIHVGYNDGNYSNNISGNYFEIEYETSVTRIHIDIESNIKKTNKNNNSYDDTQELILESDKLKTVQIDEEKVIKNILRAYEDNPNKLWELELHVGEHTSLKYPIKLSSKLGSLLLDVIEA
ncbi:hypothetical protein [Pectobacterium carotovorum]|uniref:hypothetical protein n=1 Tax=Pectobacterium carotovorum TaxID=554 RepID=UPI00057D6B9A|nr:hypothetical protein [Pectobacterium carotovorum]KHT29934.1 hypothetical protein RC98_03770 [Pectobacterium carotovorum subsp. carotovorum]KHT37702.1 hypothetical protein RC99_09485 [Pectobacterium carotovorum subsp. carotovorum]MBA0179637.1 hypothetical protein [Pectobacterium carotovorum]MBA0193502.1 hypothetical protein [Pectobacterium carotovorum]MBA0202129.1 hypothetical protein [Pectobacterium carotovorum]